MSFSTDLFKSKYENQKNRKENRITYKTLFNCCYKLHLIDPMILHDWKLREYLKDEICFRNIWEETKDGFENRSNYNYDEDSQEITFERNIIYISGEKCFTNNTNIANAHLYNCKPLFSILIRINKEINQTVKPLEEIINEQLEDISNDVYYSEQHINKSIHYSDLFVKNFISNYGEFGKQLLIKWLNKLNDSSISDEELVDEYLSDMNNARIYFESCNHKKYLEGLGRCIQFDYILLKVIEKYSPRGRCFGNTYKNIYQRKIVKQYTMKNTSR